MAALSAALLAIAPAAGAGVAAATGPWKDVPYIPTPPEVVQRMVDLAGVRAGDLVYDLGCGDGRIVIAAVRREGVRGVCVEIDAEVLAGAQRAAASAGVAERIEFVQGNLFAAPISDATVVMLYLLPTLNLRLRPRLLSELRPGARVVSHAFDMGSWTPDRKESVQVGSMSYDVFLWTIPARPAKLSEPLLRDGGRRNQRSTAAPPASTADADSSAAGAP